jgi:hypothetical protein
MTAEQQKNCGCSQNIQAKASVSVSRIHWWTAQSIGAGSDFEESAFDASRAFAREGEFQRAFDASREDPGASGMM